MKKRSTRRLQELSFTGAARVGVSVPQSSALTHDVIGTLNSVTLPGT